MFLRDLTVLTYDSRWTWDHVTSHTVLESMSIHVWIFTRRLGHYFSRYNLCVTLTYQQNGNWDSVTEYLSKARQLLFVKSVFCRTNQFMFYSEYPHVGQLAWMTFRITEIKMRLKNLFPTFLHFTGGLQWTVHENKSLYSSPGTMNSEG